MKWLSALAVVAVLSVSASSLAQCCAKGKGGDASAKAASGKTCGDKDQAAGCAKTCGDKAKSGCCAGKDKSACHGAGMPAMTFKVGDETTPCPKTANEMAKGDESRIRYIVGGQEYADKTEALKAYETALEEHFTKITSVSYAVGDQTVTCPMAAAELAKEKSETVKYRVASFTFADKEAAEKAVQAARDAADKVTMTTLVDGKESTCHKAHADKTAAAGPGKQCEYKVGDVTTKCPVTANVELVKARIVAAYKVLEEAGTPKVASESETPGA